VTARRLVWLVPALCWAACVTTLAMAGLSRLRPDPYVWFANLAAPALAGASYSAIGALLLSRRTSGWLGASILLVGCSFSVALLGSEYAVQALAADPGSLPGGGYAAWVSTWVFALTLPCGIGLPFLLFPTGSPPSRRWNLLLYLMAGLTVAATAYSFFDSHSQPAGFRAAFISETSPAGILPRATSVVFTPVWAIGLLATVGAILSLPWRYRGAGAVERAQIKWLGYVAGVVAVCLPVAFLEPRSAAQQSLTFAPTLSVAAFMLAALGLCAGLPAAYAIAILRYRLYDIDLVISRTLVYAALAAFITGVYVGIVVGLGSLLGGAGRPNLGLSILATALVAVAFQPLRERLQRLANRLVYGRRASPYEVLAEFSRQVGGEESLQRMAEVLCQGTGAEQAAVYFGERRLAVYPPAANGAQPGEERWVEVRHQGRRLGRLLVRKRRGETLTPLEEKLLSDLAHQAGLVLSNVGLTADLRARLEELRASRQRLVQAQDQERRRLERNLHDGAQQHLVSLKVRLGLAQSLAQSRPEKVPQLLQELQAEADSTLATMRELAHGIYPPLLAERGLREALQAQARRATLPVSVEAEDLRRYPQEIEAAVYFCVLEALQNVQKYARASTATVRLREAGGELRFEVRDDGCGFDPATTTPGAGLTNMRDRLDALGAQMTLTSQPGRGTRVAASIPLWREPA
jgi:signal transduction histidine kinase